jgi:FdhE protein
MAASEERLLLLDRRLAALRKARPELEDAIDLQEQLIRASLTSARPAEALPFALPREHLVARLHEGVPLLHDQTAHVDVHFAADLFSRLVNVLQQRDEAEVRSRLDVLVRAATSGALEPQRLFSEAFVQHQDHLAELASEVDVDPELMITLASQAVAPLLRAYAERLLPLVERLEDVTWQRGYCLVCGAWPCLGELRGVELSHYLRCAACGTGWRWQRLACPYCNNDDHRGLQTLTVEGEQRFRISVCDR